MPQVESNPPQISCVVCTYRRPELLRTAIESLINQDLNPVDYEILVVDNNSGDKTARVVQEFLELGINNLIYVLETRLGLSYARNAGLESAKGEFVAFLDDDAEASPCWLSALLDVYAICPDIWSVGGKVLPHWREERPAWLTDDLLSSLSVLDLGEEIKPLEWPNRLIGANYSFRKQVFSEIGVFATYLGRKGNLMLGNEDTEIQERIHCHGKLVFYTPQAIVHHEIPAERLRKSYFYRRAYGSGRSEALLYANKASRLNIMKYCVRTCFRVVWRCLRLFRHLLNSENSFQLIRSQAAEIGFLQQGILTLFTPPLVKTENRMDI